MSFADTGLREDCVHKLSFESGADIDLFEYIGPPDSTKYLRISQENVELPAFDALVQHATRYINSRRQRILLGDSASARMNPRYKCADVRPHLVVIASDADSASVVLQPLKHLRLCCQVLTRDGQAISVQNVERCDVPLGVITQSTPIAEPSPSLARKL